MYRCDERGRVVVMRHHYVDSRSWGRVAKKRGRWLVLGRQIRGNGSGSVIISGGLGQRRRSRFRLSGFSRSLIGGATCAVARWMNSRCRRSTLLRSRSVGRTRMRMSRRLAGLATRGRGSGLCRSWSLRGSLSTRDGAAASRVGAGGVDSVGVRGVVREALPGAWPAGGVGGVGDFGGGVAVQVGDRHA